MEIAWRQIETGHTRGRASRPDACEILYNQFKQLLDQEHVSRTVAKWFNFDESQP